MTCCTPRLCGCPIKINDTSIKDPIVVEPPPPPPPPVEPLRELKVVLDGGIAIIREDGYTTPTGIYRDLYDLIQPPLRYPKDAYHIRSEQLVREYDPFGITADGGIYLNSAGVFRVTGEVVHTNTGRVEVVFDVSMTWVNKDWRDVDD